MRFESVLAIFLSVGIAVAIPSPAGPKKNESKGNVQADAASSSLEKNVESSITKEVNAGNEEGLDLLRTKKSSPTTTFCVEIKPGTSEPSVVVCDPDKKGQQYLLPAGTTTTTIFPKPSDGTVNIIPQNIPTYHPDFSLPGQQIPPQEPLIFIPQLPQILPPQIYPGILNPQPQIIFVRDPNCASNTPNSGSYPWLANLTPSQNMQNAPQSNLLNPRSAQPVFPGLDPSRELLRGGLNPLGEGQMRSFAELASANSFANPLDMIYPKRGSFSFPNQQQRPSQNQLPPPMSQVQNQPQYQPQPPSSIPQVQNQPQFQPQQPPSIPQVQNQPPFQPQRPGLQPGPLGSENQYDSPLLIQCNPMIIPLSQEAYAAATSSNGQGFDGQGGNWQQGINGQGNYNRPLFRSAMGQGHQPMVSAGQAVYVPHNHGGTLYQKQALQPQMPNAAMTGEMPSAQQFNGDHRKVEEGISQSEQQAALLKGGGSGSPVQSMTEHSFNLASGSQGQSKGQNSASGFQSSGERGGGAVVSANAQGGVEKDRGYQQQQLNPEFSQPQQPGQQMQQQAMRNGAGNQANGTPPQLLTPTERMHQMKTSASQDNMVQPFMMPMHGSMGQKMSQSKH